MVRNRAVVHINIADFAAGVETCLTPALKGRPIIIAPEGAPRARVFDMNELAFREGIRKGMPLARARRLHPKIPVLPPRFRHYHSAMKAAFRQAAAFTPAIESGRDDGHLFLDITGTSRLHGPPPDVAWRLRRAMDKYLGLDPIWTLATNKLVAKAASRMVKPTGEIIVGAGEEAAFLAPLPLTLLPGLTEQECRILARFNISVVSQARQLTPAQLTIPFDSRARPIHNLLLGIDNTLVGPDPEAKLNTRGNQSRAGQIRAEHEFSDDTNDACLLKAGLALMTADICQNLRRNGQKAGSVKICLTYSDTLTSSRSVNMDTDCDIQMLKQAWDLLQAAWTRRVRIRHLGLTCIPKLPVPVQASLFGPGTGSANAPGASVRPRQLLRAMDNIRTRFGSLAVQSGAAMALGLGAVQNGRTAGRPA